MADSIVGRQFAGTGINDNDNEKWLQDPAGIANNPHGIYTVRNADGTWSAIVDTGNGSSIGYLATQNPDGSFKIGNQIGPEYQNGNNANEFWRNSAAVLAAGAGAGALMGGVGAAGAAAGAAEAGAAGSGAAAGAGAVGEGAGWAAGAGLDGVAGDVAGTYATAGAATGAGAVGGVSAGQAAGAATTAASAAPWSSGLDGPAGDSPATYNTNPSGSGMSDAAWRQLVTRVGPAAAAQLLRGGGNTMGLFQNTPEFAAESTAAMTRQGALGQTFQDLGLDQYRQGQQFVDRYGPAYDQIVQNQLRQSQQAGQRSDSLFNDYESTFRPLSSQYAKAVSEFGNDQDSRDATIASTVQNQTDAAEGQRVRNLASMGVDPSSGRNIQGATNLSNATTLAKVGAINQDRQATRLNKVNVLGQGVQTGNAVLAGSSGLAGQSIAGGSAAAGTVASQAGVRNTALNPGTALLGAGANVNGNLINAGTSRFSAQAGAENNAFRTNLGTFGDIGGVVGDLYGGNGTSSSNSRTSYLSSEDAKENIRPVSDEKALIGLRRVPVKEYDYKQGQGDGGHHVGAMAGDMQQALGDGVAPGGQAIDQISVNGTHHAAIRALDKKIVRLQKVMTSGSGEDVSYLDKSRQGVGVSLKSLRM